MKKPIDPSLNNLSDEDFLLKSEKVNKKANFDFTDKSLYQKPAEPNFKVTVNDESKNKPSDYYASESHIKSAEETAEGNSLRAKPEHTPSSSSSDIYSAQGHSSSSYSHHHHHSSSSNHHHSSSSSSHHRHSSHKKKKKLSTAAKIAIIFAAVILLIILIVAGTFFFLKYTGEKGVKPVITEDTQYEETIEYKGHTYKYDKDVVAVAFLGIDQRDLKTSDDTDFVGASDADIVVTVDTKDAKAKVIAIPRDTMVDVDLYSKSGILLKTDKMQLCLSYAYGDGAEKSCNNVTTSISRILYNVPIQKYFALDLDGIAPLNDAIGGVTVQSLYDFKKLGIKKGDTVTLKGDMTEAYVRTRDLDNIEASLNRTQRQMQYIKAYSQQVVPAVIKDFGLVSNLYNTASKYSRTNLTLNDATYLASYLISKGVTSFESYTIEGEMKEAKVSKYPDAVHAEFYPDEDSLMQTVLDVFYDQID